ncbi:ABC transporter permease [Wenjunlia tyrosinilytica]|uniref:ABC transporter permease n=1 Tax=Wenjunlia tyrosinilytica TaxID=1544741 RepID=A0A918DXN3_9ACTN|nr:ABC transporter permease [Wenjunlia tyrosinilytica]GGO89498.1 ABC transporter permease [Wenjunlia tyrosinilytica]
MVLASASARPLAASGNCLVTNEWVCPEYVRSRKQELIDATVQHLQLSSVSVLIGLLLAFPLALVARRWRASAGPVLGVTTILYTIPSLAMFSILVPFLGLAASVTVTGLVLYSLTILVRNILAGLQGVPEDVREAARGMGYGPLRLLLGVEVRLALPTIFAGLRIATVSTISLVTIGGIIDHGGLGNLIYEGNQSLFKAEVLTASVLCVVIAITADLLLLGVQRLLTPWANAGKQSRFRRRATTVEAMP